jgi:hypothetical protein
MSEEVKVLGYKVYYERDPESANLLVWTGHLLSPAVLAHAGTEGNETPPCKSHDASLTASCPNLTPV